MDVSGNDKHYKMISLNQLEVAGYVNHAIKTNVVKTRLDPLKSQGVVEMLQLNLLVSHRNGKYYIIRGFDELETLKHMGIESVNVRVETLISANHEELLYRAINHIGANGVKRPDDERGYDPITPNDIDVNVIEFCDSIVPGLLPEYVEVCQEKYCGARQCFINVDHKVNISGGSKQCGWMIQKFANAFLGAIPPAIWVSEAGDKVDVTPDHNSRTLFLLDNAIPSDGYRVLSKYKAISTSPYIGEYLELLNTLNKYKLDANNPAFQRDRLRIEQLEHMFNLKVGRNDPCPCQSGKKYKQCCGR